MAEDRARCSSCEWWDPPKALPQGAPTRADLGLPDMGECTRFPERKLKGRDEVCGEHPVHVGQRNRELAAMLAGVITPLGTTPAAPAGRPGRRG